MAEITGRHVLGITVGAFTVIIGVNLTMAYQAVSTFPGLEVRNSYVAGQTFDAERAAQEALGWNLAPVYDAAAGTLTLRIADAQNLPAAVASLNVLVGRTTTTADDRWPEFVARDGAFVADVTLPPGRWMLKVDAVAQDGTPFRQRLTMFVKG